MIDSSITVSLSPSHSSELALELSGALFRGIILPLPTPWNSWISMQTPQAGLYLHRGSAQALAPRSAWKKGKWNTGKQHNIPKKTQDQSQPHKAIKIQKKSGSTSAKVSFSSSPNSRTEGARLENLVLSSSEEPSTPIPSPIPSPIPTIPGYWMGGALHRCKALDLF